MIWLLPLSISLAVALAIAIYGSFSPIAYLLSITLIFVGFVTIKKDAENIKTSYSGLIFLLILSMLLNRFIKAEAPFPANLIYVIDLIALAYFAWRAWDEYTQRK